MKNILILASASPRRQEILKELRIPFEAHASDVEEVEFLSDPKEMVLHNAKLKANAALEKFPNSPILAGDTTVVLNDKILNKPKDLDEACSMLKQLSGNTHTVYTAICLIHKPSDVHVDHCESAQVYFRMLTDSDIEVYLSKVNTLDKAGAYAIQEHPELIIKGYKGCISTIIGLPTELIYNLLKKYNFFKKVE